MDLKEPIAHVAEDGRVHGVEEHLRRTAERAARKRNHCLPCQ